MSRFAENLTRRVLAGTLRVETTEDDEGVCHTSVTGPLGVGLLEIRTWRTPEKRIACDLGGPLKSHFADKVDAFLRVVNRLKVIAETDGKNVYNLYNPPLPSPAGLRPFERKLRTMAEGIVFPATSTISVTPRCPCRCVHCSADRFVTENRSELTTEELKGVVDQALDLGVCTMIFTGGEPMVRKDLPELIAYTDKDRATVMIFTSGVLLTERNAKRLAEAGLVSLNVSVDSADPEEHNRLRGVPGAFQRAMDGARRARDHGILTGISTYATHHNVHSGQLRRLIDLARDEGFHEVTVFDCVPTGRFLSRPDLRLGRKDIKRVRQMADEVNARDDAFGLVAQAKANAYDGGGCFGAFSQFYMTCFGDVNPCDFNPVTFGNIRREPLEAIWRRMVSHPEYAPHRHCCRMQSERYRRLYIDPITDEERLPVPIERLPGDGTLLPPEAVNAPSGALTMDASREA